MAAVRRTKVAIAARVGIAIVGTYAATWGLVAAAAALLAATGMARSEAAMASFLVGLIAYLALLLWAFAARRLVVVTIVFALLGVGGIAVAGLLQAGG